MENKCSCNIILPDDTVVSIKDSYARQKLAELEDAVKNGGGGNNDAMSVPDYAQLTWFSNYNPNVPLFAVLIDKNTAFTYDGTSDEVTVDDTQILYFKMIYGAKSNSMYGLMPASYISVNFEDTYIYDVSIGEDGTLIIYGENSNGGLYAESKAMAYLQARDTRSWLL